MQKLAQRLAYSLARIEPAEDEEQKREHMVWEATVQTVAVELAEHYTKFDQDAFLAMCSFDYWVDHGCFR